MLNKLIIFAILYFSFSYSQESKFHKDSLFIKTDSSQDSKLKKLPVELLKGIVAGDYKKLGWNEYVPRDGLEFPDIPIQTNKNHPRLITEFLE